MDRDLELVHRCLHDLEILENRQHKGWTWMSEVLSTHSTIADAMRAYLA
jgi:hypothetical protein